MASEATAAFLLQETALVCEAKCVSVMWNRIFSFTTACSLGGLQSGNCKVLQSFQKRHRMPGGEFHSTLKEGLKITSQILSQQIQFPVWIYSFFRPPFKQKYIFKKNLYFLWELTWIWIAIKAVKMLFCVLLLARASCREQHLCHSTESLCFRCLNKFVILWLLVATDFAACCSKS